jgi:NAD+ diphosphatase
MKWTPAKLAETSHAPFDLYTSLSRENDRRTDDAWLAERLADSTTEFVPIWKLQNLVCGTPSCAVNLHASDVAEWLPQAQSLVFMGVRNGHACFSFVLPDAELAPLTQFGQWMNMRNFGDLLESADWAMLAYARAFAYWHEHARFCGVCGSPTVSALGGHVRRCTNSTCGLEHYPRTDPAIIVLVLSGESCLLGHNAAWQAGRYSTLAGFVEPGEDIEHAVAREVGEEAGIRLREVRYFGSQSFPFPASLMIGFHAEAETVDVHPTDGELADARWFTRQELRAALDAGEVNLPPRYAISHHLISAWFNAEPAGGTL